MRIYSWNMLDSNPDLDRALSFIRDLNFDVLCLQEVPEELLPKLSKLPLHMAQVQELVFLDGPTACRYSVVLSNYPIVMQRDFALPEYPQTLRVKAFVWFMHLFGWKFVGNRRGVLVDIDAPKHGRVRVFCLHISLSHPQQRKNEFDAALAQLENSMPTVICGDFNILESPHITLLNWLLGGSVSDIFAVGRERRYVESKFSDIGLQNPLRGTPTQTISHSQLDHILVPTNARVVKAEVLRDRVGSDHNPILVEFE